MRIPTQETMEQRLAAAVAIFLANDSDLLTRRVSERAMTHKFAEALQSVFRSWHVDCEYNRHGKVPKTIDLPEHPEKTIYPDIIIHRRESSANLLVIEAKTSDASQQDIDYDRSKLGAYISGRLGYRYALLLTFGVGDEPNISYDWHIATNRQEPDLFTEH
jgi:hypothetical protein